MKMRAVALVTLMMCSFVQPAFAAGVCPLRTTSSLVHVQVFDGAPEEEAMLVPDKADERQGYWNLAYVYEAGRFVTVRCKYLDSQILDVKLPNKVAKCTYGGDSGLNPVCE